MKRLLIVATIFIAGCLGAPYRAPKRPEPFHDRWWSVFGDAQLEQLIAEAAENNLDLEIAAARVREARAMRGITASRGKIQVDGNASAIYDDDRDDRADEARFDARWELDFFGGIRRETDAATAEIAAVEETRRDVVVTLIAEVARNYVELRGAQVRIDILDARIRALSETRDIIRERRRAGLVTELDVTRITGFIDDTAATRASLEHAANAAIHRLGVLTGREPDALRDRLAPHADIPAAPQMLPDVVPGELLARRPDVRAAERQLEAAAARIDVARAQWYPRISLLGTAGRNFTLGPALHWPLLSGGRIRSEIEAERARRDAAEAAWRQAVLRALEDVETALSAYRRDLEEREKLESAVAAEKLATKLASERYRAGLENFLVVLDAERTLREREDRLARTETSLALSTIALYKALGGGF